MHDSTDTEHIMIATVYSKVIISFNLIYQTKPGGSASRSDLCTKATNCHRLIDTGINVKLVPTTILG